MNETLLGIHTNIAGGFTNTVKMAEDLEINCMQIFVKKGTQGDSAMSMMLSSTISAKHQGFATEKVICHTSYLPNLASHNQDV